MYTVPTHYLHSIHQPFLICTVQCHNTVVHTCTAANDDDASTVDDYSHTGDSGFSDSRMFLKEPPPTSHQQVPAQTDHEHMLDLDTSYTSLLTTDMHTAEYYKSLNRERIPGKYMTMTYNGNLRPL